MIFPIKGVTVRLASLTVEKGGKHYQQLELLIKKINYLYK